MRRVLTILFMSFYFFGCGQSRDLQVERVMQISIEHGDRARRSLVYVPKNLDSGFHPLLLVLHGAAATPENIMGLTKRRFNELADINGFFVAYPEGLERSWNDFREDRNSYSHNEKIDDAGFISSLLDTLQAMYPVDKNRIFAAGFSNGGFMCYRLACDLAGKIRAIAAVSATLPAGQDSKCIPAAPVSVMIINGTDDPVVPYNGGEIRLFFRSRGFIETTDSTVRYWVRSNKCPDSPSVEDLPDLDPADKTRIIKTSYGPCSGDTSVILYRIENGGHTWPGGVQYLFNSLIGNTSGDINACDEIWKFFSQIK